VRSCLTYLWRKVLLDFWNWRLGLAIVAFGLWALFALPLFKVYPVCVHPEDLSGRIELRGEVTPKFDHWFIDVWRHTGGTGPMSAGRRVPAFYYYAIDKQSVSYLTGIAMLKVVQFRSPGVDYDVLTESPPRFPHLWANWYAPNCYGLRKIALQGAAWVNRGPETLAGRRPRSRCPTDTPSV
jgi:hypothetical protein